MQDITNANELVHAEAQRRGAEFGSRIFSTLRFQREPPFSRAECAENAKEVIKVGETPSASLRLRVNQFYREMV